MHTNRSQIAKQAMALALVAVFAAGCASTPSADASIFDEALDLGQDLNLAVSATKEVVSGGAEPASAARAIDQASAASRQLAFTAAGVQTPKLATAADVLASLADRIVTELTQADVERAESLYETSFVPLASQFAEMKRDLPSSALTTGPPGGFGLVAFVITVLFVAGATVVRDRRRRRSVDHRTRASSKPADQRARSWGDPQVPTSPPPVEQLPGDAADWARATRIRPTDIELRSLLVSTIDQAEEREWAVSLVCPTEVQISGDPVRVQRAILATLGNAFLFGAERAGIVVEVPDGRVLLSIGHDAPIDDPTAQAIAIRLANQLAAALGEPAVDWSVAADDDIYLTTVAAGSAQFAEARSGIPA